MSSTKSTKKSDNIKAINNNIAFKILLSNGDINLMKGNKS